MRVIWKFPVPMSNTPEQVLLPKGAKFLTVQMQGGEPCMWFEVEDTAPLERGREFYIVGTGSELPAMLSTYLGTFQAGAFVFHAYEVYRPCH